jgi:hypothetical protein
MKALSELSKRCDPVVWSAILEDLRRLSEGQSLELSPEWAKELPDEVEDVIQEEERTWQDPSAHKMRVAVASWTSDRVPRRKIAKVRSSSQGPVAYVETVDRYKSPMKGLIQRLTTRNYSGHWASAHLSRKSTTVISSRCSYQLFPTMTPPQRTTDAS